MESGASAVRIDPGSIGDETPQVVEIRPDGAAVAIQFINFTAEQTRIFTVPIVGPAASAVPRYHVDLSALAAQLDRERFRARRVRDDHEKAAFLTDLDQESDPPPGTRFRKRSDVDLVLS